jgi:hypothetical protein
LYQEDIENMLERMSDAPKDKEPDEVSAAFLHALFDPEPKRRYMVVPNENQAEITIKKVIEEMVQLNEGQLYSYDRGALIAMLDEALADTK